MKPILIDELIKHGCDSEEKVTIDGKVFTGWQIAKPMNYEAEYLSLKDRKEMAKAILDGKAIAVRYFTDLTEEEKTEYVKKKMESNANVLLSKDSNLGNPLR